MYKEVNRSLIKWPVAASATMLAISWFALDDDVDNVDKPSSSQVSHLPDLAVILEVEVTPVLPEQELLLQAEPIDEVAVEQVARDERAMKLPPQILMRSLELSIKSKRQQERARKSMPIRLLSRL
jgi:hypothetical protein